MTTPDLTPTPPADTRQQAAERLDMHIDSLAHENADGLYEGRWVAALLRDVRADVAAALASSSPALPEPPAPTVAGGLVSWESQRCTVFVSQGVVRAYPRTLAPAEARLLASTLLAAADVAEEQQP